MNHHVLACVEPETTIERSPVTAIFLYVRGFFFAHAFLPLAIMKRGIHLAAINQWSTPAPISGKNPVFVSTGPSGVGTGDRDEGEYWRRVKPRNALVRARSRHGGRTQHQHAAQSGLTDSVLSWSLMRNKIYTSLTRIYRDADAGEDQAIMRNGCGE